MRAILIDPRAKTVREIESNGKLATMQELVGGWIEVHPWRDDCNIVINEEGRLQRPPMARLLLADFELGDLCGPVIVYGELDDEGDFTACQLSAADVEKAVTWL